MKKTILFLIIILMCYEVYAENVAYIYSAHNNYQYKNAFDQRINNAGFTIKRYENTDFSSFISKRDDFNMLLFGTVCNYVNTVDFAQYKKELVDYVQKGGIISSNSQN